MVISVLPIKQETAYSCTASIYQMLNLYYKGVPVSHAEAIKRLDCEPDGAELKDIFEKLNVQCFQHRELRTEKQVVRALEKGNPVVCDDNLTYQDSHAILLVGVTPQGFHFIDPAKGKVRWKSKAWLKQSATEFHVLV